MEWDSYGVKIIYKYSAEENEDSIKGSEIINELYKNDPDILEERESVPKCGSFYEQSILHIKARSFDEALEKARRYASEQAAVFKDGINIHGQKIVRRICAVSDAYGISSLDEDDGVTEVYSTIMQNKTMLDEKELLGVLTAQCTAEEMKTLRIYAQPDND